MARLPYPTHIQHKPVIVLDYEDKDGRYVGNTDCLYLSIGFAQYGGDAISMKTLRHTDLKWSRQSEEMPEHRVVDLAILFALTYEAVMRDEKVVVVPPGTFDGQPDQLVLPVMASPEKLKLIKDNFEKDGMQKRLRMLKDVLGRMDVR